MGMLIIFAIAGKSQANSIKRGKHNSIISSNINTIRVIDRDTLILNKQKIRLKGIDAPKIKQLCTTSINNSKTKVRCGEVARQKLIELIGSSKVHCTNEGKDRYNRQVYCYAGNINLNREMVREGYTVACPKYDKSFV